MQVFELFLYNRSTRIIVLTNAFKKNLVSRGIPEAKIDVVLNGADLRRYSPVPRNKSLSSDWGIEDKFVIGYIGTHGMAHGLVNVLDAAEELSNDPEILFLFVGGGAEKGDLLDVARSRGLKNVVFKPTQPKSMMRDVWSMCDIALVHLKNSPIFGEVVPSKIFEAMAMGKPIILVSPTGEASDLILRHGVGCWVEAARPKQLAQVVKKLSSDVDLLERLSTSSTKTAPNYSRESQAQRVLEVFQEACPK